jgi:hypothetical protein
VSRGRRGGRHGQDEPHEKARTPGQRLHEHAAAEWSERDRRGDGGTPDADRSGPRRAVELGGEECQCGGKYRCRTDALHAAPHDQHPTRARERGDSGAEGEHAEAREEQAPAPEPVAQRATREQEARQHERVAGQHPLLRGEREPQIGRDGRQRDDGRSDVEQQQRRRGTHHA